jgi:ATP-dependent Lhr-like helicase
MRITALLQLESQGRILRGRFTPGATEVEWCDRRLLARIHRYTLNRLRAEIEPVSAADFMRFLLHWQHAAGEDQVKGAEGLAAVIEQLEGFELAAAAWEHDVLPARVADYGAEQLDRLCLSGRVAWGRLTPGSKAPLRTSPIALLLREHAAHWSVEKDVPRFFVRGRAVREALQKRGASFFNELLNDDPPAPGLRRARPGRAGGRGPLPPRTALPGCGRFSLRLKSDAPWWKPRGDGRCSSPSATTTSKRWRGRCSSATASCSARCCSGSSGLPPWRELVRVYRRLEARGEIRGGRFVGGFGGEQFAAPDAVGRLRAVRRMEALDELVVLSAGRSAQSGRGPHPAGAHRVGVQEPHSAQGRRADRGARGRGAAPPCRVRFRRRAPEEPARAAFPARSLKPHLRLPTAREARALARVVH